MSDSDLSDHRRIAADLVRDLLQRVSAALDEPEQQQQLSLAVRNVDALVKTVVALGNAANNGQRGVNRIFVEFAEDFGQTQQDDQQE